MRLCAFDIETTGTGRDCDQILQLACVVFDSDSGDTLHEFERTIHWDRIEGDPFAIAMNSRLMERIATKDNTVPLRDALDELGLFVATKAEPDKAIAVGFNVAAFDLAFLNNVTDNEIFYRRTIELGTLLMSCMGEVSPVSSKEAVTLLGKDRVVAHDALADCRDARDLYMYWKREQ